MNDLLRLNYKEIPARTPEELDEIVQEVQDEVWALFKRGCISTVEYTDKIMEVLAWKQEKVKTFNN
jgi:hypothetical protein